MELHLHYTHNTLWSSGPTLHRLMKTTEHYICIIATCSALCVLMECTHYAVTGHIVWYPVLISFV